MIEQTSEGRRRSRRTVDEVRTSAETALANLTPEEKRLAAILMQQQTNGVNTLWNAVRDARYWTPPVSMAQFLDDPYYLGESCATLYPELRRRLIEIFAPGVHYHEVVLGGSLGYGKTTMLSIIMARQLYELSCLHNPQMAYGLSPGSEMSIVLVSKNLYVARSVLKSSVDSKIEISPYFNENFPPDARGDMTYFPRNVQLVVASYYSERAIGLNAISSALDECLRSNSVLQCARNTVKSHLPVGDYLAMPPDEQANWRVKCLDHDTQQMRYGRFEIRPSTVQPLVDIAFEGGSLGVSLEHPVLVRDGDWLIYRCARDVQVGDELVVEELQDEKRRADERGAKAEAQRSQDGACGLRGDAQKDWRHTSGEDDLCRDASQDVGGQHGETAFRRDAGQDGGVQYGQAAFRGDLGTDAVGEHGEEGIRGDAGQDAGGADRSQGNSAYRGDKTANSGACATASEASAFRGDQAEDRGCAARHTKTDGDAGDAGQDGGSAQTPMGRSGAPCAGVRADEIGYRAGETEVAAGNVWGRQPELWEAAERGAQAAVACVAAGKRGNAAHGGIAAAHLRGKHAGDPGSQKKVFTVDRRAGWGESPLSVCGRGAVGTRFVRATGDRINTGRGSDRFDSIHLSRSSAIDSGRLRGVPFRWNDNRGRGERRDIFLPAKGIRTIESNLGSLPEAWIFVHACDQRYADAVDLDRSVRVGGVHGPSGQETDPSASSDHVTVAHRRHPGDGVVRGVRPECCPLSALPRGLRLARVTHVAVAPAEQTYAVQTEFQTFVVDGVVVHNTNFVRTTKQQIKVADGGKQSLANFDRAELTYRSLQRRIKSRFLQAGGELPGMIVLVSSANTVGSFIERRIAEAEATRDSSVYVMEAATWDVKPPGSFCGKTFQVLCGGNSTLSRILTEGEEVPAEVLVDGARVITVPDEYREDFEGNLEDAIRDVAGIPTTAISRFFQRPERITEAVRDDWEHPCSLYSWRFGDPLAVYWYKLARKVKRRLPGGYEEDAWVPRVDPKDLRYIHIDTSLSGDATGICMGHVARWVEVVRRAPDGARYTEWAPHIVVDLLLQVRPPLGEQIQLADIRAFVYNLMDHGFRLIGFSTDAYQSADMLQQMKRRGVAAELVSMDRTMEPYETLRSAFYERRIEMYRHEILIGELRALEHDRERGKVDHPVAGCFVGDTRIPLLDGSCPTMAELSTAGDVWVYSATPEGRMVPGRGRGRYTKHVNQLVDVVLDSGAVDRCTPEHPFMLRDGTYRAAQDLRPGIDRLMPNRRVWPVNGGYERLMDSHGRRVLTHHRVWEVLHGEVRASQMVHHLNGDKTDNRPENLMAREKAEHSREHTVLRHSQDPAWREKLRAGTIQFNNSDEGRRKHSESMRRTALSMSHEQRCASAKRGIFYRADIDLAALESVKDQPTPAAAARVLGCGRNVVMRVLREHEYDSWKSFVTATERGLNHKVRYVIPVTLDVAVPVYDLEVDGYSNFALSSGVFVHNSKDLCDSLAGVVYGLTVKSRRLPVGVVHQGEPSAEDDMRWVTGATSQAGEDGAVGAPVLPFLID